MDIERIIVGDNFTNSYLIGNKGCKGLLIDPGAEGERIYDIIIKKEIQIEMIINTHCHFDHILANDFLREKLNVPLLIHKNERGFLSDPDRNLSSLLGEENKISLREADAFLEDNEKIIIGEVSFKVLFTPGHSPGSVSLYSEELNSLFCGDVIFSNGVGRIDLPTCNELELIDSIENKIITLPHDTKVFPGHGETTSIGKFIDRVWTNMLYQ
jgi:hydroxyacylglutathione hydrolase